MARHLGSPWRSASAPTSLTQLRNDLKLEIDAVAAYNHNIKVAVEAGDNTSRELFERILKDEEHHVTSSKRSSR